MGMATQFTTACLWEVGLPKCSFFSKARKVIFFWQLHAVRCLLGDVCADLVSGLERTVTYYQA